MKDSPTVYLDGKEWETDSWDNIVNRVKSQFGDKKEALTLPDRTLWVCQCGNEYEPGAYGGACTCGYIIGHTDLYVGRLEVLEPTKIHRPKVIPDKPIVYFDVDDTLVIFYKPYMKKDQPNVEPLETNEYGFTVYPHVIHIDMLKEHKHRGHTIVVWSAGGSAWAKEVVDKLGLNDYVDIIMPKPDWYYDDCTVDQFMPEGSRIWKEPI